jgi:hypothetical protein
LFVERCDMSIESINELADCCREWVRECDDHAELAQVREILGGVMDEAWGRIRVTIRGIKAFEGRLDACAKWLEECDDDAQAAAARRMASKRFRLPVSDFDSFARRLGECEAWGPVPPRTPGRSIGNVYVIRRRMDTRPNPRAKPEGHRHPRGRPHPPLAATTPTSTTTSRSDPEGVRGAIIVRPPPGRETGGARRFRGWSFEGRRGL